MKPEQSVENHERIMKSLQTPPVTADGEADLSILDYKLSLSPTARIEEMVRFAMFLDGIRNARRVE